MKPIITILVPVYNHEEYIGRCLRSLINQNIHRPYFEIIVINDASTDNSDSAITNFKNEIFYIRNKRRLGLPGTLNVGIKKIKTPYFVRVDSDDYVNENFLIFLLNFIEFNKYMDAIACDYYLIDKNEKILQRVNCLEKPIGCGIIFKTDQIVKLGMYDKDFLLHEDKDLRKRFLKKFNIFRLELPLYRYRQHETNITKNKILDKRFKKKLLQ
jgi:glycosyltransferase involved in cell wall biosynthesis